MRRFTTRMEHTVTVASEDMEQALLRLASLEDLLQTLEQEQTTIPQRLELLRAQGKEKTVQFRELMAQKLVNTNIRLSLERHGIRL